MVGRTVLDTNIFIDGFADIRKDINSAEAIVLKYVMEKEVILIFSDELEEQILRVSKRIACVFG